MRKLISTKINPMAKSASLIHLQAESIQVARSTVKCFYSSTAEQIEYWADLGRTVSTILDPDVNKANSRRISKKVDKIPKSITVKYYLKRRKQCM